MEIRHLRYFIAVALEENVTRAAEKLHVSQPALSRQVRDLEEELGFPLLVRSAKSVTLTEAGHVFLEEASAVLDRLEEGITAARLVAEGGHGEIHVGYAPSLTVRILPPTIRAFQSEFPKVKVKLHDLSTQEMLEGLRSGKLDFAFLVDRKDKRLSGLRFEALKEEHIQLAVSNGHLLAELKNVQVSELRNENLIGYSIDEYPEYWDMVTKILESGGFKKRLSEEHESVSSLVAAIESGMGISVVTESFKCVASGRVSFLGLQPQPAPLVIGIAWKVRQLSTLESSFLEKARESCALETD